MSPVKSISEVKDLYDLIDLYTSQDRNRDGLLGPEEVRPEEVAAGDKGGTSSATHDVKDGFLSPWEVAQMRGFTWEDVRKLRIENQIKRQTFPNIESLLHDITIGDVHFKAGDSLVFTSKGQWKEGTLASPLVLDVAARHIEIPAGSHIKRTENGFSVAIAAKLSIENPSSYHYEEYICPLGTTIEVSDRELVFTAPQETPIVISETPYSSIHVSTTLSSETRYIATDATMPIFRHSLKYRIPLPAGQRVDFRQLKYPIPWGTRFDSTISIIMSQDSTLFGVSIPKGTRIENHFVAGQPGGTIDLFAPEQTTITSQGHEFLKITVRLTDNTNEIVGELAKDSKDRISSKAYSKGTSVLLLPDGRIFSTYRESFKAYYPNIKLSGEMSVDEIRITMAALAQLPAATLAHIKGIHFTYEEHFDYGILIGHTEILNNTIYLNRRAVESSALINTIIHEAAHMRHQSLQDNVAKRIAAATRDLDLTNTSDNAAAAAIEHRLFSQSFDAKWSQVAGYNFTYSITDYLLALHDSYSILHMTPAQMNKFNIDETSADGFINAYGRRNIFEDIATCAEAAYSKPTYYRDLIDPNSKFYKDNKDPNQIKFASVYRRKLDLLLEYGFITKAQYRKIVSPTPVHPSVAAFCQTVNCR